jgi:ketosteroid isomerase-like protein
MGFASTDLTAANERRTASLLRRLFEAFEAGDMDAIGARYAEDIRWHMPGQSLLAGDYVGRAAVMEHLNRYIELTDSYRVEILDLMAGERHATSLYRVTGSRLDRELDMQLITLYAIADSAVQEVWVLPMDQATFDGFWS